MEEVWINSWTHDVKESTVFYTISYIYFFTCDQAGKRWIDVRIQSKGASKQNSIPHWYYLLGRQRMWRKSKSIRTHPTIRTLPVDCSNQVSSDCGCGQKWLARYLDFPPSVIAKTKITSTRMYNFAGNQSNYLRDKVTACPPYDASQSCPFFKTL